MKITIVKSVPILFGVLSFSLLAEDITSSDAGFLIGGGIFSAANSNCTDCDYSGKYFEVGYDFNNIVGVEAKYAAGDNNDEFDLKVSYIGVNVGHDFNTEWFRLYGKIGYASVKEQKTWDGYCDWEQCYDNIPYTESYSESGVTFGIGSRFTFSGEASGLYLKVESMAVAFQNDTVGAALLVGLGYRF